MKIIKRDKSHKSSFDKSEIENLNKNQADILKISPKPKMITSGTYEISSVQLEDLVSLYIDENNMKTSNYWVELKELWKN